jgi:hypothetical protein
MRRILFLLIILFVTSCGKNNDLSGYKAKSNLSLNVTEEVELSDFIDSISVVPLEITNDWKYIVYPSISASENLFAVLDAHFYRLMLFDRKDLTLLFSKDIKGRGRGEILSPANSFILGRDTVCVFDSGTGRICMYGKDGGFIDFLNNGEEICADYVYPVKGNLVAVSQDGGSLYNRDYVSYYKQDGSLLDRQLKIPNDVYECGVYSGDGQTCFMYNDTLRFIMPFTYHLFSSTLDRLESTYFFETDRAIPAGFFKESDDMMVSIGNITKNEYVWHFHNIFETDSHQIFSYLEGQKSYMAFIDKRTGKISINAMTTNPKYDKVSLVNIWRYVLATTTIIYADNDYLYGYVAPTQYEVLKSVHDLDSRLESYSHSLGSYIEKNSNLITDADTRLLIKIKLK